MNALKLLFLTFFMVTNNLTFSQKTKIVNICWDASYSMKDRNLGKEFYFLDAYFKTVQNAEVTLLTFSDQVLSKDSFAVNAGNWSALKEKLQGFSYDGGTSYKELDNYVETGDVLLFTDGHQNMAASTPNFDGDFFVINSCKDFDKASLNLLTIVNNGNLINLSEKNDSPIGKKGMNEYSGIIYNGTTGMANAEIYVRGDSENGVRSNNDGSFNIEGVVGDTLVVAFGNRKTEHRLDENLTINFSFGDGGTQLQEVVVMADIPEQESEEEIVTAYGKENKDIIGYAVQSISDEDISDVSTTANIAIQGKFSGVKLGQNDDLSQVIIRPSNSILGNNYGLIVIDGVPVERSNSYSGKIADTDFIDPQNIADITVLKGLAATNRFGSMGANGVLLITTKTASFGSSKKEKKDLARLRNNVYDGKIKVNTKTLVTPYLKELKKGKNVQDAYNIYLLQRETYWNSSEYLLDVFEFFHSSSPEIANRILSNVLEKKDSNYEELRGMYLKCLEKENHEMALLAADKMLEKFPNRIQSYLDVAIAQKNKGNYQEALNILNGIVSGDANTSLNFNSIEKVAGTELRNLINTKRQQLDFSKVNPKYQNNVTYNARLVLDWNNPDAEFTIRFVNPQKRFFNWEHTELSDKRRILDELQQGYSHEQFEIFGADTKGDWLLNVTYLGNRTSANKTPTFIKCMVQHNFGKLNQRDEQFWVRLQDVDEEQPLAKFTVE